MLCPIIPDSYPFVERRFTLETPFVIGRQNKYDVTKAPSKTNGFFNCTLMSRDHAEIAVGEDGKFFITDLKSTNGTYVNSVRLKENEPTEIT